MKGGAKVNPKILLKPKYKLNEDLIDLITRLMVHSPEKRLGHENGISDVKNHKFFANVDW